jgi:hypothetical protein
MYYITRYAAETVPKLRWSVVCTVRITQQSLDGKGDPSEKIERTM